MSKKQPKKASTKSKRKAPPSPRVLRLQAKGVIVGKPLYGGK